MWHRECQNTELSWEDEHFKSRDEILKLLEIETNKKKLIKLTKGAELTGYCSDCYLADFIKENKRIPSTREINDLFEKRWDEEVEYMLYDEDYISEKMEANEYTFLKDGSIFSEVNT